MRSKKFKLTFPLQKIRRFVSMALVAAIGLAGGPTVTLAQLAPVAASSAGATGLSLKEAAQLAILGNPEVLARWHTIKAAQGERDAARGALFPRVDLSLSKGRERGDVGTGSRSANSLSLTQLLFDGFATRNEIERLDHATRVRLYEFFDASEAVALEAVRAYVDVLRYRELVRLAEDNYVEHRAVFTQTDQRVQAKVAPAVDLEQVRGRLALADSNVLTEQANLHDTTARFQRIIGRLPGGPLALPPYVAQDIPGDANAALARVQERHGALLAAMENVRAANSALASRKGAFGPRVDFRLRKEHGSSLSTTNANANATTAEVLLTWNLFNGFGDTARQRQFAEQLNVARDLRDKVCRDTRQTLMIAYNDVNKLRDQTEFLALHEGSTSRALTAYRLQFSIGQRTLLSLLDTENELFQARRAVANARHDLHFAYARTQAGLGNLLRALELTSLRTDAGAEQLPAAGPDEAPVECPPEPVGIYASNKQELIERAAQLTRLSSPAAQRNAPPAVVPAAVPVTPASPTASAAPAAAPQQAGTQAVNDALEAWRVAWAERNLASYFGTYAPGISPARGVSRDDWEAGRRSVIGRAKNVSLAVQDVAVQLQDATHATAVFKQVYRSANYRDEVIKTLRWERIGNRWLIVEESAVAPR